MTEPREGGTISPYPEVMRDDLREQIAKEIWDVWESYNCLQRPWETAREAQRQPCYLAADAAIRALVAWGREQPPGTPIGQPGSVGVLWIQPDFK